MSEKENISKKELRRRKRKRALMIKTGILCVLLVIFGIGIWALAGGTEKIQQKAQRGAESKIQHGERRVFQHIQIISFRRPDHTLIISFSRKKVKRVKRCGADNALRRAKFCNFPRHKSITPRRENVTFCNKNI